MKHLFAFLLSCALVLPVLGCASLTEKQDDGEWTPGVTEYTADDGSVYYTIRHPEKDGVYFCVVTGPTGATLSNIHVKENYAEFINLNENLEVIQQWTAEGPFDEIWGMTEPEQ